MSHRRILQTIQVEFEDAAKIPELTAKIREEILSHPTIDSALPMHVHFLAFGPHGCDIGIDAYSTETDQGKFYLIQEELLLKIQKTLMEREIKIAIPKSLLIERSLSVRN
jgi:small-conductance mechanosensitive channel